jgi:RNA polymerase sigma factor (sigma-70 family)
VTSRRGRPGRSTAVRPPPFQKFLEEYREPVYRFLVALVGPNEAEDCFQETFVAALRAYPRLAPGSNLRAWVMQIARRKAIDSHRSTKRRPWPVADVPDRPAAPGRDSDPRIWRLVRDLPTKQRDAVVLRFVGDLPYREVARITGGSEAGARQNVRLGLAKLREGWT